MCRRFAHLLLGRPLPRRLAPRWAGALAAAAVWSACDIPRPLPRPPLEAEAGPVAFPDAASGARLHLPAGWREVPAPGIRQFLPPSGPAAASSLSVVLQARPTLLRHLDEALDAAFAPVAAQPEFVWEMRAPGVADGHPTLFYVATYCHLDVLRRRAGALLLHPGVAVDISLNAPAAAWGTADAAWVTLWETLEVAPQDGPGVTPAMW